jgi:hypothetical protein
MIFSENQVSPIGSKPEGMLFGIMLQRFDSYPTMAQAESKKNARLPDETCGKICGAVMTRGSLSGPAAPGRRRRDHFGRTFVRITLRIVGGLLAGLFHEAKQLAVNGVVAGCDIAFGQNGFTAIEIADETAGLAHEKNAGGHVPGRQIALPKAVEAAGGHPGEIERGGAEAAQAGEMILRGRDFVAPEHEIAPAVVRQPASDDGVGEPLPRGDADAPVVEESAFAAATMAPSRSSAIETAKCGMPCRKLVVPSSGSTIHR